MDNRTPLQPKTDLPGTSSAVNKHFTDGDPPAHGSGVWTLEAHPETSVEKDVRQTLYRIYLAGGIFAAVCLMTVLIAGFIIYRRATYIDPVKPDHSILDRESDTYWKDRTLIDIATARNSKGTEALRIHRLRTFVNQTTSDAFKIESPHSRAQAVTDVAIVLAQQDINISLDHFLKRLGNTSLIASMRARTLISQALMHLRLGSAASAQVALLQYNQLVAETDLKMNSPIDEESFFGAVTVLWLLNDRDGLRDLFTSQTVSATALGFNQQMRVFRLIAGEQVRVEMITEALETTKLISNHVELARAWVLILQYSARPPIIQPIEPKILDLPDGPQTGSLVHAVFAKRAAEDIFAYLAANKDVDSQVALLRQIAGSRLMCDVELYTIFRNCLAESEVLNNWVKQPALRLLDDPESPAIRAALNMPPRTSPVNRQNDAAIDDWTASNVTVQVERKDIDAAPLRVRTDQQIAQAQLAIAQSYLSIRRFDDADRVLKQALRTAEGIADIPLLLRIGEQHAAIGSIADAQQSFAAVAPGLNQNQKGELARLQIIARLFDDAQATIASIAPPTNREYVSTFLLQELIRLNHLDSAERTLSLMPQGRPATEARSRLKIAGNQASRQDFNALGIPDPDQNWEQHCVALIRQGFLRLADQSTDRISDVQIRAGVRGRIAREYLLLYRAFNDVNDPNRSLRQEIRQEILSVASRAGQPNVQTAVLTELLTFITGQLLTEEDRADGKRLWTQAMAACRTITMLNERATLFAQLIVVKNMLENPNLAKRTLPFFTRESNLSVYEEQNRLIEECTELVNTLESEMQQANACVHLARALAQIGRTASAQRLIDHVLNIAANTPENEESVSMLLSLIPVLRAMNSVEAIPVVYRLTIDKIAHEFTSRTSQVDEFEWRMRDSDIERVVRSQMENGFIDDAVGAADRLNEPMLRDRLLRTAAYVYLDHGNFDQAEQTARRLIVREIRNSVNQSIQTIKRRSATQPSSMSEPQP